MESLDPVDLQDNKNKEDPHHREKNHGVKSEVIYAGKNCQKKPEEKNGKMNKMDPDLKKAD
jgi:hypothetical protein